MPGTAGTGQFSLADLLTWTTAIAATIGFLRMFFGARVHAVPFSAVPVQYVSAVTPASSAAVLAAFVVAGPCMRLAASRRNRLRGSLRITLWALAISVVWGIAASVAVIWFVSYGNRLSPWGFWGTWKGIWGTWMPWWQTAVYACESLLYLIALEAALLANLFALQWLGLRWTKPV